MIPICARLHELMRRWLGTISRGASTLTLECLDNCIMRAAFVALLCKLQWSFLPRAFLVQVGLTANHRLHQSRIVLLDSHMNCTQGCTANSFLRQRKVLE